MRHLSRMAALLVLAGCDTPASEPPASDALLSVHPRDFAVLPCAGVAVPEACAIVKAGGKTLLIGAPEGAHHALERVGVESPDLVLLPDLSAARLEGLLRVRNGSWQAGRSAPLALVGPEGTQAVGEALDRAMEWADADAHLRQSPSGGFAVAVFRAADLGGAAAKPVFDTGDLLVTGQTDGAGAASFRIHYGGLVLEIAGCGFRPDLGDGPLAAPDRSLSCQGDDLVWPIAPPGVLLMSEGRAMTEKNTSR